MNMNFSEVSGYELFTNIRTDLPNELHVDRDTACKISGSLGILPTLLPENKTKYKIL